MELLPKALRVRGALQVCDGRDDVAAHQKLAKVLMSLGRTDEARQEMETAKALEENSGKAL